LLRQQSVEQREEGSNDLLADLVDERKSYPVDPFSTARPGLHRHRRKRPPDAEQIVVGQRQNLFLDDDAQRVGDRAGVNAPRI
jgi:hypothetical protein